MLHLLFESADKKFQYYFDNKFGDCKNITTFAIPNRGIRLTVRTRDSQSLNRSSILLSRTKGADSQRIGSFFYKKVISALRSVFKSSRTLSTLRC